MRTARLLLLFATCAPGLATGPVPRDDGPVRFGHVDVYVDSGQTPLAAYQVEIAGDKERVKIVGIEGGEHAAFKEAPYYDPEAMQHERVILGAFSLNDELPAGAVRVARLHVMVTGEGKPEYSVSLTTSASSEGRKFEAAARIEQGEDQ